MTHSSDGGRTGLRAAVHRHPLATLLVIAAILRLIAVIFARGYMASDDHFLVIRPAADWLNGLHTWFDSDEPVKRGVLYPYTIYALMGLLKTIGVTDPGAVMFVNRLLHALWSLTLIPLVYFFLKRYADDRAAFAGGLLMAAQFVVPFMAVRNLVEVVSQPFVLAGLLLVEIGTREEERPRLAFWGGVSLGLAFMMRIQTAVLPIGVFFTLIALRRWRPLLTFSLGGLLILLLEGSIDYLSFGTFLSSVLYSLPGQAKILHEYVTNPWYTYILTIAGILVPPFSLLVFAWAAKAAKRVPVTFWATVAFLVVHSLIPQKQERFILPVFPALIVLAMTGWSMVAWRDRKWVKGSWAFMWAVNILLLPVGLFNYSQKARVEPLLRLGRQTDGGGIVAVTIEHPQWLPYYYAQMKNDNFYYVMKKAELDTLDGVIARRRTERNLPAPKHVILFTHKDPSTYLPKLEAQLGPLTLEEHVGPSLADWVLHKMNPRFNHSKESYVYRIDHPSRGLETVLEATAPASESTSTPLDTTR